MGGYRETDLAFIILAYSMYETYEVKDNCTAPISDIYSLLNQRTLSHYYAYKLNCWLKLSYAFFSQFECNISVFYS